MQRKVEVKVFRTNKVCPICKQGDMVPTGMILTANPPLHVHKCNMCGRQESYKERYPFLSYEDIEEELKESETVKEPSNRKLLEMELSFIRDRLEALNLEINSAEFRSKYNSEEKELMLRQSTTMVKYVDIVNKRLAKWREQ